MWNSILYFQGIGYRTNHRMNVGATPQQPHQKFQSNLDPAQAGNNSNLCPIQGCGRRFFNLQGLFNHQLQSNHFDKYCCMCDKMFTGGNLKRHVESVHSKVIFECWMCQRKYNREDNLKAHQLKSHGMATCKYCQAAFRDKDQLRSHTSLCPQKPKGSLSLTQSYI